MPKRSRSDSGTLAATSASSAICILLPGDLLSLVFSKLDIAERARASRVCRLWRAAALQSPHSTTLTCTLKLRLTLDDARCDRLALRSEAAAAALRGPLCSALQRLNLSVEDYLGFDAVLNPRAASALRVIGGALPPTLVALSIAGLNGPRVSRRISNPQWNALWRDALATLDLARTAPRLEELDLEGEPPLAELELSHPTLRRLGARIAFRGCTWRPLAPALRRLPCLKTVALTESDEEAPASDLDAAALADAGIRTERIEGNGLACMRFLRPGSCLLWSSSRLPSGSWTLPLDLDVLRLHQCSMPPSAFEFLLCRMGTYTYAPGLPSLSFDGDSLIFSGSQHGTLPRAIVAALGRGVSGGTQIEIEWPYGYQDMWREPGVIASLGRTLAGSPALARYVHVALSVDQKRFRPLPPAVAADFAAYRRARAAALRGMGEAGRRLLAEQGYDREQA